MGSVITAISRTPIGRFGGAFTPLSAVELGAASMGGALDRAGLGAEHLSEILFGHVIQAEHRIRVTITGADAHNHAIYPDPAGGAPTVTIHRAPNMASLIELPVFDLE